MTVELRGRKTERSDGDPQVPDPGNAGGGKSPRGSLSSLRLTLLGVGAMNSPRYRPAGLLVSWPGRQACGRRSAAGPGIRSTSDRCRWLTLRTQPTGI